MAGLTKIRELKLDIPKEAKLLAERMLKDLENSKRPYLEAVKTSLDNSEYNSKVQESIRWSRKYTLDLFEIEIKALLNS